MTRFTSRLIFLAALLWLGCLPSALALRSPTPLPSELAAASSETRVGGCDQCAPGRSWPVPRLSLEIATGSEACGYESASGQQNWLNRDPIGERGGINLYGFVGNNPISRVDPMGLDFHVGGATGILAPGPLGYLYGDTALEQVAAGSYNALPELGNIAASAASGALTLLSAFDQGVQDLLTQLTGDPQLGNALNNTLAVTPIGWPEDLSKLGKLSQEAQKLTKCERKLLNPAINATDKGMQHTLERHIVNGIPEFAGKSKFTTGTDLTKLIEQGTQMPMVRQPNGNFARVFDAGQTIGIDRATGSPTSIVTIITSPGGNLVTMFPGRP